MTVRLHAGGFREALKLALGQMLGQKPTLSKIMPYYQIVSAMHWRSRRDSNPR